MMRESSLKNSGGTNFMLESSVLQVPAHEGEQPAKNLRSNFMNESYTSHLPPESSVENYSENIFSSSNPQTILELRQILIRQLQKHSFGDENLNSSQSSITNSAGFMQIGPYASD